MGLQLLHSRVVRELTEGDSLAHVLRQLHALVVRAVQPLLVGLLRGPTLLEVPAQPFRQRVLLHRLKHHSRSAGALHGIQVLQLSLQSTDLERRLPLLVAALQLQSPRLLLGDLLTEVAQALGDESLRLLREGVVASPHPGRDLRDREVLDLLQPGGHSLGLPRQRVDHRGGAVERLGRHRQHGALGQQLRREHGSLVHQALNLVHGQRVGRGVSARHHVLHHLSRRLGTAGQVLQVRQDLVSLGDLVVLPDEVRHRVRVQRPPQSLRQRAESALSAIALQLEHLRGDELQQQRTEPRVRQVGDEGLQPLLRVRVKPRPR